MVYMNFRIVVVDERQAVCTEETISPADLDTIEQADVIIYIDGNGIRNDTRSTNSIDVVTPATEAERSEQRAIEHVAQREAKRNSDPPPREALKKAYLALGNSEDFQPPPLP